VTERQIAQKAPYPVGRGRKNLLLVRLRTVEEATFLRWLAQGYRHHAGRLDRGKNRPILFLRLQTVEERTTLRRQPRQAVTHYVETRPARAALAERNPAARIALSRMLDTHNTSGSHRFHPGPLVGARGLWIDERQAEIRSLATPVATASTAVESSPPDSSQQTLPGAIARATAFCRTSRKASHNHAHW
jgi:hypothetical protein